MTIHERIQMLENELKKHIHPGDKAYCRIFGHDTTDRDKGAFGLGDHYWYKCRRCKENVLED